jgi:TetR/AcrR family transcriptional regulator, repressor of fatR-cypB operon
MLTPVPQSTEPQPFYLSGDEPPAKKRILTAALRMFVRDGLCETSIRDIAQASGFTNPALFKHFAGKDALAKYLFERCYLELFRLVQSAAGSGASFRQKQRAMVDAYLIALDQDVNSVLYVQEWLRHFWPDMPPRVRRCSILGEIRAVLAAGRTEGAVTGKIDLDLLTTAWVGTLQQFARAKYFGEFQQDSAYLAECLDQLLWRLVAQ